jgi:hypothetical protein
MCWPRKGSDSCCFALLIRLLLVHGILLRWTFGRMVGEGTSIVWKFTDRSAACFTDY